MTSIKKRTATALTATILVIGLIIGPSGTDYTVISSNPDTVAALRTTWRYGRR